MKRILIKLSGEMLTQPGGFGIDAVRVKDTADKLIRVKEKGVELALVVGGGNIFRGLQLEKSGLKRTPADQIGMLATIMNGVALKTALEKAGAKVRLISALECPKIAESYQYDRTLSYLNDGEIVIFVGGTGNPYFTTDTCAALRAAEIEADLLVKATKVDGVYDRDPKEGNAKKFVELSYSEFLSRQLKVMDMTAVTLCLNERIPIFVFCMDDLGIKSFDTLIEEKQGTLIKG